MSAYVGICLGFLASIGLLTVVWGVISVARWVCSAFA